MVQNPSGCFSMSALGPLQKFTRTLAASGALTRSCTLPALSTRGYSAPQTFVAAGWKVLASCAQHRVANRKIIIPAVFIVLFCPNVYAVRAIVCCRKSPHLCPQGRGHRE